MNDPLDNGQTWVEDRQGRRTFVRSSCSLGRASMNEIVIEDTRVSRRHALIHRQGEDEYWLVDFGSSNGTYLNGKRIAQPVRLRDGDRVQMGPDEFVFRQPGGTAQSKRTAGTVPGTALDVRMRCCWLLVADIVNSTRLAKDLAPGELPLVTGRWLGDCKEVIEERSGRINQFMGDGFFAFWLDTPEVAQEVIGCSLALRAMQARANPPFRFVLHLAPVMFGGLAIGEEERISGEEVYFVFRMERLAGRLGAPNLLSMPVRDRLVGRVSVGELGRHALEDFPAEYPFFCFT
jgi:pSer/pThr/pTyr-binding forkhead associated (FHA) protein